MALVTQQELEKWFSSEVVKQWADDDRDGQPDADVIDPFLEKASSRVETKLKPGYPNHVPFQAGNVPEEAKELVFALAGYWLAGRRQKAAEHYATRFQQALDRLKELIQPGQCLMFPDGTTVYAEGSVEEETQGGPWSSTLDQDPVFTDEKLDKFVGG